MTRSVTIVNTSNWEHEDYIVRASRQETEPHSEEYRRPEGQRLKPGESVTVFPRENETFAIDAVEDEKPEPFYAPTVEGRKLARSQVLPKVTVTLE